MAEKKVYGLILPKKDAHNKPKPAQSSAFNVFGDDSDEEEKTKGPIAPYRQGTALGPNKIKRQAQMDIDKALLEDPSVYEYDAIYDEIQASKPKVGFNKERKKDMKDRKPKYITGLLKAAELKKKEEERRKERQVQKEREAEGEMYADKEKFVTSAYKQKMLEMQEEEEKEKREAAMEAMLDVTKQKDMSGFYRYLYRETAGNEVPPTSDNGGDKAIEDNIKKEPVVKTEQESPPSQKQKSSRESSPSGSSSSESDSSDEKAAQSKDRIAFSKPNRPTAGGRFRKRRADSSSPETTKRAGKDHRHRSSRTHRQRSRSRSRSNSYDNHRGRGHNFKKGDSSQTASRRRRSRSHSESPYNGRKKVDQFRSRDRGDSVREQRHLSHNAGRRSRSRDKRIRKDDLKSSERKRRHSSSESPKRKRSRSKSPLRNDDKKHRTSRSRSRDRKVEKSRDRQSISENLKAIRGPKGDGESETLDRPQGPAKSVPIDPAKKVYPHHNSAKDIAEARKRYLQRKIARERKKGV